MFCANMSKLLVIVALFAIPIISQESTDTYDKFGLPETINRLECKNASTTVIEKEENFYQEFVKCVQNTVDIKQMNQDFRFLPRNIITTLKLSPTLSDLQISSIRLFSQSYCPKITTLMTCEETYSSIYTDCLPAAKVQAKKIKRDTVHRLVDYFCDNNAENIIAFINGKFIDCVMPKQYEMRVCLRSLFSTMKVVPDSVPLTTNAYCKSIDDFFTCSATILQQCVSSDYPGKLMESLRLYVQSGICSTAGNTMNLRRSLL